MRRARIESPALEGPEEVRYLHGEEALGELFSFRVVVAPPDAGALRGRELEILRHPIRLTFEEGGEVVSEVFGVAREVSLKVAPNDGTGHLSLTLVPRLHALSHTRATQIFLDRTLPEIIADKLEAAGFARGKDFVLALRGDYPAREFVVQYQESDLAFVQRLAEHAGITLFFRHAGGRDVAVFADSPDVHEQPDGHGGVVEHHVGDDRRAAFEVEETFRRVPERVLLHDYNYRTPQLDQRAGAETSREVARGALVDYGVHVKSPDEAMTLAQVRAEEVAAGHHQVRALTRDLAIRGGARFTLRHGSGAEQALVVTRVVTRSHHDGAPAMPETRAWHNEVTAIPAEVPYRPPRVTPRPRVHGLVHAAVDGAVRGPYAEIDDQGRYKVRFRYDLAGRPDLGATHRVRMMQPHAGTRYGMHFPLRPGTEVLIGFVEGDPDRPVIVGTVPNPTTPSPVEEPNLTHNVLRTGSGNEMVLDDLLEQERIRIHTPNENTTLQLGYMEEPELGALLATDANVTEAAGRSINELTDRKALLSRTAAGVAADTSVTLAGVPSIGAAADDGIQRLGALGDRQDTAISDIARMALPAGAFAEDDGNAARVETGGGGYAGLFSDLAGTLAEAARDAGMAAVREIAEHADETRIESVGRRQGEPVGQPGAPAVVHGSLETAALFGRRSALFYGERVASVSSWDTAAIAGGRLAELRSPGTVEVSGARETLITSAGTLDVASGLLRIVAGYYPQKEAPELDDGTSLGMMARKELRITSVEDCILVCAHKNLVAAAHTGEMRLKAQKTVSIQGGSVVASGGYVGLNAGGDFVVDAGGDAKVTAGGDLAASAGGSVSIEAGGAVSIKGATVTIEGGTITLNGPVTVCGDLTVTGAINGG